MTRRFQNVAVLMGGDSPEAAVSRKSGEAVTRALTSRGYNAIPIEAGPDLARALLDLRPDACFLATHGGNGENGALQGFLEMMGLPYTGSGVLGSALGMSKIRSRILFERAGITVPETVIVENPESRFAPEIPFAPPFMVKPESAGSSIGVARIERAEDLPAGIREAARHSPIVLVEPFLTGREIQAGILDGTYLGAIEIVPDPSEPFYTYDSKYREGKSKHLFPAPMEPQVAARMEESTVRAFEILGLRGVARMDALVLPDGRVVVLEMNTLPGLTATSLIPEIAQGKGFSFPDLVETILSGARLDSDPSPQPR